MQPRSRIRFTSAQWDNSFVTSSDTQVEFWSDNLSLGRSGTKPTLSANTDPLRRINDFSFQAATFAFSVSWNEFDITTTVVRNYGNLHNWEINNKI